MDDYLFRANVQLCRIFEEATSYLEIFSYSDPNFNTIEEHPLKPDEFEDFVRRRGDFKEPALPKGVKLLAGVRLVLQQNAKDPNTFAPRHISLKADAYISMIEALHLSYRSIECTTCLGPLFWSTLDQDEEHLQIIYRKSNMRKKDYTRGWEVLLSHEIKTCITTGFCKGTPSSYLGECLKDLQGCVVEIGHPLLLPFLILSHEASFKTEMRQLDARDWLRRIENAVSIRSQIQDKVAYIKDGAVDLDSINRDLVECHAQVLWKNSVSNLQVIEEFKKSMDVFYKGLSNNQRSGKVQKIHASIASKLEFYKNRMQGIENYSNTTLQRLEIQRSLLNFQMAKLSFQVAGDQRKIALASKQDSSAMKTIAILGIVFLPGTFLASIFSTTFFDFQNAPNLSSVVSPRFWIYWVVAVPITLIIVSMWYIWERKRARMFELEEAQLGGNSDELPYSSTLPPLRQARTLNEGVFGEP
ncbi:hypothetical protein BDZ45DRAFT_603309 [Acephala macrosclerotiorum]|nr:hypothetical protein BDZ45DRAFT_603309 [Acephala macrosclerotiorum]